MTIIDNFNRVRERIIASADSAGRNGQQIKIIAVSKTFPADMVQEAIDSGIMDFGENKIQEAKDKFPQLSGSAFFHMIGHLQSNKAKEAVRLFDVIHSLDKYSTAERVDREAEKIGKIQKVLLQVNTSKEDSKSGAEPEEIIELAGKVRELEHIELLGLMTMAPYTENLQLIHKCFGTAAGLLDRVNGTLGLSLKELSMGMSHDFEIAVKEGATMVRIGGLIFGERTYK